MKKFYLLLLAVMITFRSAANVADHQFFQIFINDTLSVESISMYNIGDSDAKKYLLQDEIVEDQLNDGIVFTLTEKRYFIYFPAIHTKFVVRGKQHLGEHLLYLLDKYRKDPQLLCNNN